jgi:hypothetical protein
MVPKDLNENYLNSLDALELYKADYNGLHSPSYNDWVLLREKIETFEGPFNPTNKKISTRFDIFEIEDSNGNIQKFFFDKFTNTLPLKDQNTVEINFNVPYIFKNGQQVYNNYLFNLSENKHSLTKYEDAYPITSIYIPSKGYGGSLNNVSWDKIRPEENDYQAFEYDENKNPYLTFNDEKDYIYLSDADGIKLPSRNGLFWLETDEQIELSYNKLFAEKQQVKFWPLVTDPEYDSYQKEPSIYNFYKLPLTPISVYVPKRMLDEDNKEVGKVWLQHKPLNDTAPYIVPVTLLKIFKAGEDQDLNDYEFEFTDYTGTKLDNFEYDDTNLLVTYTTNNTDNIPVIKEKIIVKIHHTPTGQRTEYDLYVQDGEEKGFVTKTSEILFNNKEFLKENEKNLTITFDDSTISKNCSSANPDKLYSNDDSIILENNYLNTANFVVDLNNYPTLNYFLYNNENIYLDIRDYNIQVLTNKDWIKNNSNEIQYSLYTGDQCLAESIILDPSFEVKYNLFTKTLDIETKDLLDIKIESNIFTWNEKDIKTEKKFLYNIINGEHYFTTQNPGNDTNSKVLISGLPGYIIMNYPKYRNFKELIDNKLQLIEYKVPKILKVYPTDNSITDIDPNYLSFKLQNIIDTVDMNAPYLKIKILPVQTVYPEVRYLNNPDYIYEVDTQEKDEFGYDRVWINENLTSNPPIIYRNFLYNENPDYYTNTWKNKDGYMIYLCNSEGKFVRPGLLNGLLKFIQIDEETNDGDCRPWIYGNVDPRFNLPELILKTSVEKYLNDYYIEGLEINPLVLTLNIKDQYNSITQKFDKIYNIYTKKRVNNTIEYVKAQDSYITLMGQNLIYDIGDKIYQNAYSSYFDYENGIVRFIVKGPDKEYKLYETKYFYGIKYSVNTERNNLLNNFTIRTLIDNDIRSDFYINTKEDLTDKKNKDHAVVEITEMGIFDKYNHLCAYLSHPKVQYRSDSSHLSYSLIIEEA